MSTDVYFDFHSQEGGEIYRAACLADNTNGSARPLFEKWFAFLKKVRGQTPENPHHYNKDTYNLHYDPTRVGYLSNFVADCNFALWAEFQKKWEWEQVSAENIPSILLEWTAIYANSQKPENAEDCGMVDDISTPEELRQELEAHLGYYLTTRVD